MSSKFSLLLGFCSTLFLLTFLKFRLNNCRSDMYKVSWLLTIKIFCVLLANMASIPMLADTGYLKFLHSPILIKCICSWLILLTWLTSSWRMKHNVVGTSVQLFYKLLRSSIRVTIKLNAKPLFRISFPIETSLLCSEFLACLIDSCILRLAQSG